MLVIANLILACFCGFFLVFSSENIEQTDEYITINTAYPGPSKTGFLLDVNGYIELDFSGITFGGTGFTLFFSRNNNPDYYSDNLNVNYLIISIDELTSDSITDQGRWTVGNGWVNGSNFIPFEWGNWYVKAWSGSSVYVSDTYFTIQKPAPYKTDLLISGLDEPPRYKFGTKIDENIEEIVVEIDDALWTYNIKDDTKKEISTNFEGEIGDFDVNANGDVIWTEVKKSTNPKNKADFFLFDNSIDGEIGEKRSYVGEIDANSIVAINDLSNFVFVNDTTLCLYVNDLPKQISITDSENYFDIEINNSNDVLFSTKQFSTRYSLNLCCYDYQQSFLSLIASKVDQVLSPIMSERDEQGNLQIAYVLYGDVPSSILYLSTISANQPITKSLSDWEGRLYNVTSFDMSFDGSYVIWAANTYIQGIIEEEGEDADVFLYYPFDDRYVEYSTSDNPYSRESMYGDPEVRYSYWANDRIQLTNDFDQQKEVRVSGQRNLGKIFYYNENKYREGFYYCDSNDFVLHQLFNERDSVLLDSIQIDATGSGILFLEENYYYPSGMAKQPYDLFVATPQNYDSIELIANAGPDQFAEVGSVVQLDGSESVDYYQSTERLTYNWIVLTRNSEIVLNNPNSINPYFTAPLKEIDVVIQLTVTDNHGFFDIDQMKISVYDINDPNGDADRDGLPNSWEINGVDDDGDGIIDVDLPSMGANPLHKDIFVEVDYEEIAGEDYELKEGTVELIMQKFDEGPIDNPDGKQGIHIHVDAGPEEVMYYDDSTNTPILWGDLSQSNTFEGIEGVPWGRSETEFGLGLMETKEDNFSTEREYVFYYGVYVDLIKANLKGGGRASLLYSPFDGFAVSRLHRGYTAFTVSSCFIHEIGHLLGLFHGGGSMPNWNEWRNYKPNYQSLMNYLYCYDVPSYSSAELPPLDENSLDERNGLGMLSDIDVEWEYKYYSVIEGGFCNKPNGWIDWNHNNIVESSVEFNLNDLSESSPYSKEVLLGCNDWAVMDLDKGDIGKTDPYGNPIPSPDLLNNGIISEHQITSSDAYFETNPSCLPVDKVFEIQKDFGVRVTYIGPNNIRPGEWATFDFEVTNVGKKFDDFLLEFDSSLEPAHYGPFENPMRIRPGGSKIIRVDFIVPKELESDAINYVSVMAKSYNSVDVFDSAVAKFTTKPELGNRPVADSGRLLIVEATSLIETNVELNGSGSYDYDGDQLSYTWNGLFGEIEGERVNIGLPVGISLITLNVSDSTGLFDVDTCLVLVKNSSLPDDLTIVVDELSLELTANSEKEIFVSVIPDSKYDSRVTLSSSNVPQGIDVRFDSNNLIPPFSSKMIISANDFQENLQDFIILTVSDEHGAISSSSLFLSFQPSDDNIWIIILSVIIVGAILIGLILIKRLTKKNEVKADFSEGIIFK